MKNYVLKKDLLERKTKETTMVYNPENSDMYELNDVAGELYEKLKINGNVDQIIQEFATEYSENIEIIASDTMEIINRFLELGILTEEETL